MKSSIKNFKTILKGNYLPYFIIILIGLIPLFTWFKPGYLIAGLDYFPPLDSSNAIKSSGFIWTSSPSGGAPALSDVTLISPFYLFWGFFKFLGFSYFIIEKLWFISFFLVSGLSMYYLVSVLLPKKKYVVASIVSAVFYMFNLGIVGYGNFFMKLSYIGYVFTPLILGLFIAGLKKKEKKYAFYIALCSILLVTSASNPPTYAIIWLLLVAYFIYHIILEKKERSFSFNFFLRTIVLCLFMNTWWIISLVIGIFNFGPENFAGMTLDVISYNSINSSFLNIFRLLGKYCFDYSFEGVPYYAYASSYSTPILYIITCAIPILAFSTLFINRNKRTTLFFLILSSISIFLAKGLHSPLESVNKFIYLYIPGFRIFRDPPIKFNVLTAFCYAVLIGITVNEIYNFFGKRKAQIWSVASNGIVIFAILLILASAWPIVTGDVIPQGQGKSLSRTYTKIPDYWFKNAKWIDSQKEDSRVFLSPRTGEISVVYEWGYNGADIVRRLIYKPYLEPSSLSGRKPLLTNSSQLLEWAYDAIRSNSTSLILWLGLLNTRYILQRNDLNWEQYDKMVEHNIMKSISSPEHVKFVLNAQKGFSLTQSFGKLDLYKISDEYFLPHIYASPDTTGL